MEKVAISLPDVEVPAKRVQTFGKFSGVVKDFVNLELSPVVEAAVKHGRLNFWQAVVNGCRSLFPAGIHEEHATTGSEAGADKPPELCESLSRHMGKPKPEKDGIELLGGLPLEQVCVNIVNKRGAEPCGVYGEHLRRTIERGQVRSEGE